MPASFQSPMPGSPKRWGIAIAGTILQLCLGTVYAWSYFQSSLVESFGWTNTQVAWVFSLAICFLGLSAAWGGMKLGSIGPRRLAVTGAGMFGAGYLIAALALREHSLLLLYLGYGVLGGIGLGLGYVTPVATAAKWFPDKKGLVTGMVIMGFGFGALLMSKILVPGLMAATNKNLVAVFLFLGTILGAIGISCAAVLRMPPDQPVSNTPVMSNLTGSKQGVLSLKFANIWAVFFCNIVAGIAVIGFLSPLLQALLCKINPALSSAELVSYGGTLIAIGSVFNGLGRLFWGAVSDRIGRTPAFRLILGTQMIVFLALAKVSNPWLFAALVCYVMLCYGGGFGTMPSLVLDTFGPERMPVVYGAVLTAWSGAGIVGPQIVAWLKDHHPTEAGSLAFLAGGCFLMTGFVLSFLLKSRC